MKARTNSTLGMRGYLLTEALVYISALLVLLGVAFAALYQGVDASIVLRRNADDIARAVRAGELWRADIRNGTSVRWVETEATRKLQIQRGSDLIEYQFSQTAVLRRVAQEPWAPFLENTKTSFMHFDQRGRTGAWIWDVELQPAHRGTQRPGRVKPVFTFLAVPKT